MRILAILLPILMLLHSLGCAGQPGEIMANLGQEVELKIGQTASIEGEQFEVKFLEIVNDSRCPQGATCIWQGEVSCNVEITYFGSLHHKTLTQPGITQESSRDLFKEYSITFTVRPYPNLGSEIKTNEYRLRLMIEKNAIFEDTKWFLSSYGELNNLDAILEDTTITATFDRDTSKVSGSGGCNTYFARYEIKGSMLSISEIVSTEMACTTPQGVMNQEQKFLSLLADTQSFQVDDTTLTLMCSDGKRLYFTTATR